MANETRDKLIELLVNEDAYDSYDCKLCTKENDCCDYCHAGKVADHLIANDVVSVVRCKGCKYFITDVFKRTMCNRMFTMIEMKPDDFCSYGERKTE